MKENAEPAAGLTGDEMRRQRERFKGRRWFRRRFIGKKWPLVTALFFFGFHLLVPVGVYAQGPAVSPAPNGLQTANGETAAIEELAGLLVEKGLLKREDVAAITQKKGEPGFSGIQALTELLKTKGLITSDEAVRVTKKAETARGKVVLFAERDPKEIERMTQDVTREIRQDVTGKVKAEIKEEVLKETREEIKTAAAPDWTKRARFGGDMRLRDQGDFLYSDNASAGRDRKEIEKMKQDVTGEITRDVREQVKAEIKDEVLKETREEIKTAAAPEWTKRIRFSGDLRLRYQGDFFASGNAYLPDPNATNYPNTLLNTTNERERFRVRARLGAEADIMENLEVGIRLSTGNNTNPVSTNQTMGNYLNNYSAVFDRVYLKYTALPGLTLTGGRFANPFFHTALVWGPDVSFDGFVGDYRRQLLNWLGGFATFGAFPIQEIEYSSSDKWLYAGQLGVEINPRKEWSWKTGVAFYDFKNTQGIPNNPSNPHVYDYTAPLFVQKGNTMFDIDPSAATLLALAPEYRELNFTSTFDIAIWDPVHVVLLGDYVRNVGFNSSDVARLTGVANPQKSIYGYQFGLSVGHPIMLKKWDWKVYGYYRYLQADAVIDAFTDPDFHLGGTNAKGWILGADLGIGKNFWISTKYTTANEIEGPPLGIDSFFFDVNTRF